MVLVVHQLPQKCRRQPQLPQKRVPPHKIKTQAHPDRKRSFICVQTRHGITNKALLRCWHGAIRPPTRPSLLLQLAPRHFFPQLLYPLKLVVVRRALVLRTWPRQFRAKTLRQPRNTHGQKDLTLKSFFLCWVEFFSAPTTSSPASASWATHSSLPSSAAH